MRFAIEQALVGTHVLIEEYQLYSFRAQAVGADVLGHRGIANSWVPVAPVVGGAVKAVVIRPRALSHSWELVGLVGGARPTLAVGGAGFWIGAAGGGGGSVVRLPKADHQVHHERLAQLLYPGALGHPNPGHVDGEIVLGQLFSESAGAGNHCLHRLMREALVRPGPDLFPSAGFGMVFAYVVLPSPLAQCRGWSGQSDPWWHRIRFRSWIEVVLGVFRDIFFLASPFAPLLGSWGRSRKN